MKEPRSMLPGIITAYDGQKASIRPLIDLRYKDGSSLAFPIVEDVPVITPATAFAGIKLPIKVGDKVTLLICDLDIQRLLFTVSTAGLSDPGNTVPATGRKHNITDAVAYTGFQSLDDMIPSDEDVWIFNNLTKDNYNHIRLKADGSIELLTNGATVEMDQTGNVSIDSDAEVNVTAAVKVTITAPIVDIVSDTSVNITTPITTIDGDLVVTGDIAATDVTAGSVSLLLHTHGGVDTGPGNTGPPN